MDKNDGPLSVRYALKGWKHLKNENSVYLLVAVHLIWLQYKLDIGHHISTQLMYQPWEAGTECKSIILSPLKEIYGKLRFFAKRSILGKSFH